MTSMTSSRPYLIRAIYEWLVDNGFTPYIMVDASDERTCVPEQFIEEGKIVLNIQPTAVCDLRMGNETLEFEARFSGFPYQLSMPIRAVKAIYAFENGRGMIFSDDEEDEDMQPLTTEADTDIPMMTEESRDPQPTKKSGKGKPTLKLVKK